MKLKIIYTILFLLISSSSLLSQNIIIDRSSVLGIKTSYPALFGEFSNYYSGSYNAGIFMFAPAVFIKDNFQVEIDFDYTRLQHDFSQNSTIEIFSLGFGFSFFWEWNDYLSPYTGFSLQPSIFSGYWDLQEHTEIVYRNAMMFKAGNFIYLTRGFGLRLGVEYSISGLSSNSFRNLKLMIAATYSPASALGERKVRIAEAGEKEKVEAFREYFLQGKEYLKDRDVEGARKAFSNALSIDSDHEPTIKYLKIVAALEDYLIALSLLKNGNYYRAIPILNKAKIFYSPAKSKLQKLRSSLKYKISGMEKRGENYFAKARYKKCIRIMKKIKLIEPSNKYVKIFMPRAKKRLRALKTLR